MEQLQNRRELAITEDESAPLLAEVDIFFVRFILTRK